MRKPLIIATIAEGLTGLALVTVPSVIGYLLLGVSPPEAEAQVLRFCGIALLALSVACWPKWSPTNPTGQKCLAMFIYNLGIGALMVFCAISRLMSGPLLLPAAVFHIVMAGWLAASARLKFEA